MNVLMISNDRTMAMDKEKAIGDSQDRHIVYGKYLSNLFIVSFSGKTKGLKVKKLSDNVIVYPICYTNPFSYLWEAYSTAKRLCQENKIDVITTQNPFVPGLIGYLIKRKFNLPLNIQLHGVECLDNSFWLAESRLHYFLNALWKFVLRKADSFRTISQKLENYLTKDLNISPDRIVNFPISTELSRFVGTGQENDLRAKFSTYEHIVLFVGRLSKQKNAQLLLRATPTILQRFPATLFLVVGDGPERTRLQGLVNKLEIGDNVIFEGKVTNELLPAYYRLCDIFVFPSNYEGWGMVAIEAMFCQKPVVMTDVGCAGEAVIDGKNGFVVLVSDVNALAQKIIYLLENAELRAEMGKNGYEYAKHIPGREKDGQKLAALCQKTIELAKRRE